MSSGVQSVQIDAWTLHTFEVLPSTNPVAGQLPAWNAVTARTQTAGRGRTGRVWVSDLGGLWLSACVPAPGQRKKWSILPLVAGWALIEAMRELGIQGLRLRWPNDIMVGSRKLAGLLVEQYRPELAVIGIGLNVSNRPDAVDASLSGHAISLSELLPATPVMAEITGVVLRTLKRVHQEVQEDRFADVAQRINAHWDNTRRVELALNNSTVLTQAAFRGIDVEGRLLVECPEGVRQVFEASEVSLLRELN